MSGYRRYFRLFGAGRRELQREMADEIEAHIAMREEDLVRSGMARERARVLARERFGDRAVLLHTVLERQRRRARGEFMESVLRDVKLAWRQLRRAPGSTALTVATFALGIGMTTAVFAIADVVLLRPLPFARAHELVLLAGMNEAGEPIEQVSYEDWADLQERNRTLSATAIHMARDYTLLLGGRGRSLPGAMVSLEYFDVLRAPFLAGRGFAAGDLDTGALVVSESLWRTELGAQPLDGAQLDIDGVLQPVVGVVASGYEYPSGARLWRLFRGTRRGGGMMRNNINWTAIARLAPNVSVTQAQSELHGLARAIHASDPAALYMHGAAVTDLRDVMVRDARSSIHLLFGAVSLVLLIGCANIAALTLARAARRRAEIATLLALGARRGRVFRQLLTEQLALALLGGALGVLVARMAVTAMARMAADRLPRAHELTIDARVLSFALAASVLAGLLAGVWPALRASASNTYAHMHRRGVIGGRQLAGGVMLAGEVAVALVLLVGGSLLLRSLYNVLARDVGFDSAGVAAAQVVLTPARFFTDTTAPPRFWQELLTTLRAQPTVTHAALANWLPTTTGGITFLEVEGVSGRGAAAYRVVSEAYHETVRMPMVRGRAFNEQDAATGERVAVISRALAERHWPDADPVGMRVRAPGMEGYDDVPWLRVIGVTTDVRHGGHESEPTAHLYVLQRQRPEHRALQVVVRTRDGSASSAARVLESVVGSMDPAIAVHPRNLERELASLTAPRRLLAGIFAGFAALAVLLAATGIYGLFSYAVVQRTPEIGIRSALGADRARIVRLVLGDALRVVLAGTLVGALGAYWLTKLLQSQLADVSTADPLAYAIGFAVIIFAALLAAALPSLRAARVDPQVALRSV